MFGWLRVTRFYVPLLLQAFSQSLTYPLVAGIVSHGTFGVNALTAFTQGQVVMFMIGCLGGGLVMTGMVFARNAAGYQAFGTLNGRMAVALLTLQVLASIHPIDTFVFSRLFNLPPELASVARETLLFGVVMQAGFFLRNVPMVVLFNNLESGKANTATLVRLALSVLLAMLFPRLGWVGPMWGLVALTGGVLVELLVTHLYARPFVRRLLSESVASDSSGGVAEQFRFTLPLSFGAFLLALSPLMVAAFVGRSADATDMLAIHYVTIGVANPVAYAALRLQAVAIRFPPEYAGDRRLLVYSLLAGLALGVIPLVFALPLPARWYFCSYQNLPAQLLAPTRLALACYAAIGVIQAVRARIEGIAAVRKRPRAVMAGQIAYTAGLIVILAVLLPLKCPGWIMAVAAITVAPICASSAVYATLFIPKKDDK